MLGEYTVLFFSILFFSCVSFGLILLSLILGHSAPYSEKLTPYECGFNPFEDARKSFDVQFYVLGLLFIIFDVEVVLLLPLILVKKLSLYVGLFLLVLIFGFFYEWKLGILDWRG